MQEPVIEIVCYTDPYCTWCWGSEPILGKIEEVYGGQVRMSYVMGGLVEDIATFSDPGNTIGGKEWYRQVAGHWVEASSRHGMPVDEKIYFDIKDDFRSTWPANIAVKAAQLQGEDPGKRYLRRLRIAAAAERKAIHRREVQLELAGEVGLDTNRFQRDIDSGAAEESFRKDREECRKRGVRGFPSYLIRSSDGKEVFLRGYTPFETFDTRLRELAKGTLVREELTFGLTPVKDFIGRKGKSAPQEVAVIFGVELVEAAAILKELSDKGLLHEQKAGNGHLYTLDG